MIYYGDYLINDIGEGKRMYLGNDLIFDKGDTPTPPIYGDNVLAFEFSGSTPQRYIINSRVYQVTKSPVAVDIVKDLNVTNFDRADLMFNQSKESENNITKITSIPVSSTLISIDGMFLGCSKLTEVNLSKMKTDKVETAKNTFNGCSSLVNLNLSFFNVSKLKNLDGMFTDCSSLEAINLMNWDLTNVSSLHNIFLNCISLKRIYMRGCNQTTIDKIKAALVESNIPEGQVAIVQ